MILFKTNISTENPAKSSTVVRIPIYLAGVSIEHASELLAVLLVLGPGVALPINRIVIVDASQTQ